jgi:hypothetical protein
VSEIGFLGDSIISIRIVRIFFRITPLQHLPFAQIKNAFSAATKKRQWWLVFNIIS